MHLLNSFSLLIVHSLLIELSYSKIETEQKISRTPRLANSQGEGTAHPVWPFNFENGIPDVSP